MPKVFIGCSNEALPIARALEFELHNVARTEIQNMCSGRAITRWKTLSLRLKTASSRF